MVLDYFNNAYEPAVRNASQVGLNAQAAKKNLDVHEKNLAELRSQWSKLEISSVEMTPRETALVGEAIAVRATIRTHLPQEWLDVQLIPAQGKGETLSLQFRGGNSENTYLYECIFTPAKPCMLSLGLRVTPSTRIFPEALDLQLVAR
jgi:hypothetical protein